VQNRGEEIFREKRVYKKKTESGEWFSVRRIVVRFREDRWMDVFLVSFMIMSFAACATRNPWPTLVHSPSICGVEICTDYYSALSVQWIHLTTRDVPYRTDSFRKFSD
jgi:hypothetical protein